MIDMHVTPDTDVDSIRGAVLENSRLQPGLAGDLQRAIEEATSEVLRENGITDCTLDVDLEFVNERVPGAPRERINAELNVEGDDSSLASVDGAVDAPERARVADAAENLLVEHLADKELADVVETTVIVTPVQFR